MEVVFRFGSARFGCAAGYGSDMKMTARSIGSRTRPFEGDRQMPCNNLGRVASSIVGSITYAP